MSGQIPAWAAGYVGIPFLAKGRTREGLDCWGLPCLVFREQFGVELPSYAEDYDSLDDRAMLAQLISGGRSLWTEVGRGFQSAPLARPGDLVTFRIEGYEDHFGIVLGGDQMLHARRGADVAIARYLVSTMKFRIGGFYRHAGLPA